MIVGGKMVPEDMLYEKFSLGYEAHGGNEPRSICRALRCVARDWTEGRDKFVECARRHGLNPENARIEWYNGRKSPKDTGEKSI